MSDEILDKRINALTGMATSAGWDEGVVSGLGEMARLSSQRKAQEKEDEFAEWKRRQDYSSRPDQPWNPESDATLQRTLYLEALKGESTSPQEELENFMAFGGDPNDLSEAARTIARRNKISLVSPQDKARLTTVANQARTVFEDADLALQLVDKWGNLATGSFPVGTGLVGRNVGFLRSHGPGAQTERLIESVKSNVGFDQLLQIKKSGAGLGNVTEKQLESLQSVLGKISVDMNPAELKRNLKRIQDLYADIVKEARSELGMEERLPDKPPALGTQKIKVRSPNGVVGTIDSSELQQAIQAGWKQL